MPVTTPRFSLWEHVLGTFTNAGYYLHVQEFSWWTSIKVLMVGMVIAGALFSLRLHLRDIPMFLSALDKGLDQVSQQYPQDLVITWNGEQLTTNTEQPHSLAYPEGVTSPYFPERLLYYSAENPTTDQLSTSPYSSHLLVFSPTTFYLQNASGQWTQMPLTEVPGFEQPFTITQENKNEMVARVKRAINELRPVVTTAFVLASPFLMTINTFIQGLLDIFLLYLLLRLYRFRMGFKKVLQLCLHIWIVAQIINQLTLLLYGSLGVSLFSITFWVVVAYLLFSWNRSIMNMLSGN